MESVIQIPESLAQELDMLAESEHKPLADYAVDVLWRDVERNKQQQAMKISNDASPAANVQAASRRHIGEVIRERMSKVPPEIMASMPTDGASQHDHYIYGTPKRS